MGRAIVSGRVTGISQAVWYASEEHKVAGRATTYPVESGKNYTDNYVAEPQAITMEGWVSDVEPGQKQGNPAEVWGSIRGAVGGSRLLSVHTALGSYHNMAIIDADAKRDGDTPGGLIFFLKLEEVLLAVTEIIEELTAETVSSTGPAAARTANVSRGSIPASPRGLANPSTAVNLRSPFSRPLGQTRQRTFLPFVSSDVILFTPSRPVRISGGSATERIL